MPFVSQAEIEDLEGILSSEDRKERTQQFELPPEEGAPSDVARDILADEFTPEETRELELSGPASQRLRQETAIAEATAEAAEAGALEKATERPPDTGAFGIGGMGQFLEDRGIQPRRTRERGNYYGASDIGEPLRVPQTLAGIAPEADAGPQASTPDPYANVINLIIGRGGPQGISPASVEPSEPMSAMLERRAADVEAGRVRPEAGRKVYAPEQYREAAKGQKVLEERKRTAMEALQPGAAKIAGEAAMTLAPLVAALSGNLPLAGALAGPLVGRGAYQAYQAETAPGGPAPHGGLAGIAGEFTGAPALGRTAAAAPMAAGKAMETISGKPNLESRLYDLALDEPEKKVHALIDLGFSVLPFKIAKGRAANARAITEINDLRSDLKAALTLADSAEARADIRTKLSAAMRSNAVTPEFMRGLVTEAQRFITDPRTREMIQEAGDFINSALSGLKAGTEVSPEQIARFGPERFAQKIRAAIDDLGAMARGEERDVRADQISGATEALYGKTLPDTLPYMREHLKTIAALRMAQRGKRRTDMTTKTGRPSTQALEGTSRMLEEGARTARDIESQDIAQKGRTIKGQAAGELKRDYEALRGTTDVEPIVAPAEKEAFAILDQDARNFRGTRPRTLEEKIDAMMEQDTKGNLQKVGLILKGAGVEEGGPSAGIFGGKELNKAFKFLLGTRGREFGPISFKDPEHEASWRRTAITGVERDLMGNLSEMLNSWRAPYPELPRDVPANAPMNEILRNLRNSSTQIQATVGQHIYNIHRGLTPAETDLFWRKVYLNDLAEDVARGIEVLPQYGRDIELFKQDYDAVTQAAEANGEIMRALALRKKTHEALKNNLSDALKPHGIDVDDILSRENYLRHRFIRYVGEEGPATGGKRGLKNIKPRYRKRKGAAGEIVTNVAALDSEVWSQFLRQATIARALSRIKAEYDILPTVMAEAKDAGLSNWKAALKNHPGYDIWYPDDGNMFYKTYTMPERLARKLMEGQLEAVNVKAKDLREVLAVGGKRPPLVVPKNIAKVLNRLSNEKPGENVFKKYVWEMPISVWKQYKLMAPQNVVKYNLRNVTGDLDGALAAFGPAIFEKTPKAINEIYDWATRGRKSPELREYLARGMSSTLQGVEMGAKNVSEMLGLEPLEGKGLPARLAQSRLGKMVRLEKYWKIARQMTDAREHVIRYAAYLHALEAIRACSSRNGTTPNSTRALRPKRRRQCARTHTETRPSTSPIDQSENMIWYRSPATSCERTSYHSGRGRRST